MVCPCFTGIKYVAYVYPDISKMSRVSLNKRHCHFLQCFTYSPTDVSGVGNKRFSYMNMFQICLDIKQFPSTGNKQLLKTDKLPVDISEYAVHTFTVSHTQRKLLPIYLPSRLRHFFSRRCNYYS